MDGECVVFSSITLTERVLLSLSLVAQEIRSDSSSSSPPKPVIPQQNKNHLSLCFYLRLSLSSFILILSFLLPEFERALFFLAPAHSNTLLIQVKCFVTNIQENFYFMQIWHLFDISSPLTVFCFNFTCNIFS